MTYTFRTKPFAHQKKVHALSRRKPAFAYLMEQGTGKTKVCIDQAGDLFEGNLIDALIVVGPNEGDIPANWLDQLGLHLPKRIQYVSARLSANMRAAMRERLRVVMAPSLGGRKLRVITTNVELLRAGSSQFNALLKFTREHRCLLVVDESTRIKSHAAAQTKGAIKLGRNAAFRRICSGTAIVQGPLDAYSQFNFLDPVILGFESFTAFRAHYCQMLPPEHGLVRYTVEKMLAKRRYASPEQRASAARHMVSIVQIPQRMPNGEVVYKNQEQLAAAIKPHSFRVLKEDCLDLPPKLYHKRYVELTPAQRAIYNIVKTKVVAEFVEDQRLHRISAPLAIVRLLRLQQIVCNHYAEDADDVDIELLRRPLPKRIEVATRGKKGEVIINNPRMAATLAIIDSLRPERKVIIWCRHHPEIHELVETLTARFGAKAVGQIHGKVTGDDRVAQRKRFQNAKDPMRFMVGQVRSGIGIDLYAATVEIYYSNSYSLDERLQSEDRAHRIGQTMPVDIYDLEARDTLDTRIIEMLRAKKKISEVIMGDDPITWI